MAGLAERLLEHGIRPPRYTGGNQKLVCPQCSHTRRKRSDACLSLTIDGDRALWKCHHCQWSGAVNRRDDYKRQRCRPAPVKPTATPGGFWPSPDRSSAQGTAWAASNAASRISRRYRPALLPVPNPRRAIAVVNFARADSTRGVRAIFISRSVRTRTTSAKSRCCSASAETRALESECKPSRSPSDRR